MKNSKKIFILLPDGVGLRNFAYSEFNRLGKSAGFQIVYWNRTIFPITNLGIEEIKIKNARLHPFTDIYKNVRKNIELTLFGRKTQDPVYDTYRFKLRYKTFKTAIKNTITKLLIATHTSDAGLQSIRNRIKQSESRTPYFKDCLATLQREMPDLVFCTNQRQVIAIAPILAAQKLHIPTATFIFSWDNLPKATLVVETDYYFVWSELMKLQLLDYYPYIKPEQIFITGTTQFESHFDTSLLISRAEFFAKYGMDKEKKYICFSGDDITSSPDDHLYLEDTAKAINELNLKGHNLGIVFRRCPVDFSGRYDETLKKYKEIIIPINPEWELLAQSWDSVFPKPEDVTLLANTIAHTEMVVNLGSSMVFDYVTFKKPCAYFNYNQNPRSDLSWDIHKCYKYVHFRSMPNRDVVVWFDSPREIVSLIEKALSDSTNIVRNAEKWFEIINQAPPTQASQRILETFDKILQIQQEKR